MLEESREGHQALSHRFQAKYELDIVFIRGLTNAKSSQTAGEFRITSEFYLVGELAVHFCQLGKEQWQYSLSDRASTI